MFDFSFIPIALVAFFTTLISLLLLRPLADRFGLVDFPSSRKLHKGNVPLIGGLGIFIGLLSTQAYQPSFDKASLLILVTSFFILILGVMDDRRHINVKARLTVQVLLTSGVIWLSGLQLETLGYFFGLPSPLDLGLLSPLITILAVVGLTNAFNLIDGADGLAGGLALIAFTGMLFFGGLPEGNSITPIVVALAASVLPFLFLNLTALHQVKVFLGDGGSLPLAYIIAWTLIYQAETLDNFAPSAALWCVAVPLFDFFSVLIYRIAKRLPLTIADRNHTHHFLESQGFSVKASVLLIILAGLVMLSFGVLVERNAQPFSFVAFLTFFSCYLWLRFFSKFTSRER